jgi:FkbM family methyltransferase
MINMNYSRTVSGNVIKSKLSDFVLRYLSKRGKIYFSDRGGHRMAVYANDWIGNSVNVHGVYERENLEDIIFLMKNIFTTTKEFSAIDVGANIGNHSLFFAKFFKKVYSFEPNPHTFRLLEFNSDFAGNILPFNFGLSDYSGEVDLYENNLNFGSSSIYGHTESSVKIKLKPLDSFLADVNDVRLIKIDVEGMELSVLKGAKGVIERNKPLIAFEQHPDDFIDNGETNSIQFLRSLGYEIFWNDIDTEKSFPPFNFFRKIKRLIFGYQGKRIMRCDTTVPKKFHSMLYAVHRKSA